MFGSASDQVSDLFEFEYYKRKYLKPKYISNLVQFPLVNF